jgi:flagellar hook-basal body complex protein FliE
MITAALSAVQPATAGGALSGLAAGTGASPNLGSSFVDMIDSALRGVSDTQASASTAEANYASGVPGASLGKALVASDRAEVAWNATVAVRNEVVSAYQSVMSMQF